MMGDPKRVLSVQSHVVHGYVGNRSVMFPLQLHNYEVDNINSVQLSCHTQYDFCTGQVLSLKDLETIYDSLKRNGSNAYDALLTGYVGDPNFLNKLAHIVSDIKAVNPSCRFYCDPVLGDNGHIYVPKELIPIYVDSILPLADVLMPNQFEAELLTGCKITDEKSAISCMDLLHSTHNIPTIILSSTELPFFDDQGHQMLATYLSYRPDLAVNHIWGNANSHETLRIRATFPKLGATFFGTGDLFSCLILAYFEKDCSNIDMTVGVASLCHVFRFNEFAFIWRSNDISPCKDF
ncbi:unnamed protein product [Mesocestoides corti]|uniref:Pyridoxal kinase n=1 Tax=Mesocestoides corti TaxID=53468 RepID=A0A3P6HH38_MESCO|nr:unnamed protein product [Mesocestoides corti]